MTNLKAIHSRLRRVAGGESKASVYPHVAKPGIDHDDDKVEFADACFDHRKITAEWLRELIDAPVRRPLDTIFYTLPERQQGNTILVRHRDGYSTTVRLISVLGDHKDEIRHEVTTRGELVRLLSALGVFDE